MSSSPVALPPIATLVLHPELDAEPDTLRNSTEKLTEAVSLAAAIALKVCHAKILRIRRATPATLLGRGQTEQMQQIIADDKIELVVVNHALSPVQQRNLEKHWQCKVIDRTGLILEIFGARARTQEGRLQVELAALNYQRSRLVRSWTHLERQRGGFGFLGGPGESQLEIDRRLIGERIDKIKRDLLDVRRTRGLHREQRQKQELPIIALVGYTNAGKSSLFNALSGAQVLAKDMLFATLDTTLREVKLPSGRPCLFSDTVGFISALPTSLVEAFKATLEELQSAQMIIHVRDISSHSHKAEAIDVYQVLSELGIEHTDTRLVEVLNKIDLLDLDTRAQLQQSAQRSLLREDIETPPQFALSAVSGQGLPELLEWLDHNAPAARKIYEITLPHHAGAAIAWLHQFGEVQQQSTREQNMHFAVALSSADYARFAKRYLAEAQV